MEKISQRINISKENLQYYVNWKINYNHSLRSPKLLTWAIKMSFTRGFVRGSTTIQLIDRCFRSTSFCVTMSLMYWYWISICFALQQHFGFLAYTRATILPQKLITGLELSSLISRCWRNLLNQIVSWTALKHGIYSTFMVNKVM